DWSSDVCSSDLLMVEVDVTSIPKPGVMPTNVPDKFKTTSSGAITPARLPVSVAVLVPSYNLSWASASPIVMIFGVISAVKPVGSTTVYFEASAPPSVCVEVTAIPVPAFTLAKVPVLLIVTSSLPTIPTRVDPDIVAAFVLSYTLLSATAPVTVSSFGLIVITSVALPVPPSFVAVIVTLYTPVTVGVPVISPFVIFTLNPPGSPIAS